MGAAAKVWHDVGSVEELEREGRLIVQIGGREIGVVATEEGPRAIRNRCPHHGGPLCLGRVARRIQGSPGRYERDGPTVLRCPWHGWEFDLETGRCADDPALRAAVYPVSVAEGRVLVAA